MNRVALLAGALVLAFFHLALPGALYAQARAGDNEISGQGLVVSLLVEDDTANVGIGILNIGRFLTDKDQIGGGPLLTFSSAAGETQGTFGFNAFYRRYFAPQAGGRIYPYAGGEFFLFDVAPGEGATAADTSFASGVIGVKNYLTDRIAIDFRGSFGFGLSGDINMFQFVVGLSHLF